MNFGSIIGQVAAKIINGKRVNADGSINITAKDVGALSTVDVADYIVKQGKTDIWTWRKWHSGKCEIDGQQYIEGPIIYSEPYGKSSLYTTLPQYFSVAKNLPFEVLDKEETCTCMAVGGQNLTSKYASGSSTTCGVFAAVAPKKYDDGVTVTGLNFNYHITGRYAIVEVA